MEYRESLVLFCIVTFLFCSSSATGSSLTDVVIGGSQDSGISVPGLPPPSGGSVLQRKILDTQPYIFKNSDRLLREAEISRDQGNVEFEECMAKVTGDINNLPDTKQRGLHYSVDQVKQMYNQNAGGDVGFYSATEICMSAFENYNQANKQYRAALAATGDKDYERQARIFESGARIYEAIGNTQAQEQMENAAMAARARAAAESLFIPLPIWIAVFAVIGGLVLSRRKRE
jgi:hypothetical protein